MEDKSEGLADGIVVGGNDCNNVGSIDGIFEGEEVGIVDWKSDGDINGGRD